ncbi:alpha/beta fold hydrolase [Actinoplanes auranticolor]|uniref:Alpha/beta hydrolase n=1 Tax=Actinoplanes auranticolor TaxID=47988 RepID=A0A919SQP6_9ACTN|nr:alpha/beta hydrolase [Actinoplanes auranticolor]GIM75782.1 alpha/beta hydrolase [Actinoplanes auranticolor]
MTKRRVLAVTVVVLALLGLIPWAMSDKAPVGHFSSAADKDDFLAAYRAAMAGLPTPERTLDVRTSYGIVRLYRFAGAEDDQPPLVLVPGRAAAGPMWADNLPGLLEVRSVYTVDLLGEPGLSVQDRPITTERDHAAWLRETLAQLPEQRVHLVGYSIGGWTAMNLVVHAPDKVASLTLIEPVLVFAGLSAEAVVRSIPASVSWLPKGMRDSFNSWLAGGAPVEDEPVADMIEAGMRTYRLKLSAPGRIPAEKIAAVDTPTLVIMAGASPMHDAAAAAELAGRTLRNGTVVTYPGASHAVNGEHPAELARDIAGHVARHS